MSYAATMPSFASQHRSSLLVSAGIHVLLLAALSTSLVMVPRSVPQLAIEAVVIDESTLKTATPQETTTPQEPDLSAAEAERLRQAEAERQQAERRKAEQQRLEQEQAQQQRAAEEQRRSEEARIRQQQEQQRQAEAAERARKEQEQREAAARAEAERKQREAAERAAAERQRMLEQAAREEQARREAELQAALQADQELLAARQSGEMSRYIALIQQKVERNWVKPPSAGADLECEVAVVQLPNGDVVDARTVRCNGDDAVRRSIENAVRRSSPLPLPENRVLFDRNLSFIFTPEQ